jgi:hypothetical protein
MSPIKASWLVNPEDRKTLTVTFDRGQCRALVHKMIEGGKPFVKDDKLAYEWLQANMPYFLKGTIYEELIPAFSAILTNAWEGGEKVFFDLELLRKLDTAITVFLLEGFLDRGFVNGARFFSVPLGRAFSVDKSGPGT